MPALPSGPPWADRLHAIEADAEFLRQLMGSDEPTDLSRIGSTAFSKDFADEAAALAYLDAVAPSRIDASLVTLRAAESFVMGSRTNTFPVTVTNGLGVPIQVRLEFASDSPQRIRVPAVGPVTVGPGQAATVDITPEATANGVAIVRAQLTTVAGDPLGRPLPIEISATDFGRVGWIIIVVSGAVVVGGTALRIRAVQRERSGKRTVSQVSSTRKLIGAGAIMASGTMISRILGVIRVMLVAFILGNGTRQADMLALATMVPNSLYILFAGGALNTVLVPQIVRAIKNDDDGGEAYTSRIMTAFMLIITVVAVVVTIGAPLVTAIYTSPAWRGTDLEAQYASLVALTYLTLPQIFFYGAFFLLGQVLNARDKFGPMMWAPIANNIISIAVMALYFVVWGNDDDHSSAFTTPQILLLGIGTTLGIVAQTAVMIPYVRKLGFKLRPASTSRAPDWARPSPWPAGRWVSSPSTRWGSSWCSDSPPPRPRAVAARASRSTPTRTCCGSCRTP